MKVRSLLSVTILSAAVAASCGERNPSTNAGSSLAAPTELTVVPLGAGLHARWRDNESGEEDFEVERRNGAAPFATVVIVAADGVQYHDQSGLVAGESYTYRVRARTSTHYSGYSNEATAVAPGVATGGDGGVGTDGGADAGVDAGVDGGANQAPSCVITAPADGGVVDFDAQVTFAASASDPEDGALPGGDIVWTSSLSGQPLGTGVSLTRTLPSPGVHTVTCTATDADGATGSSSIVITSRSPVAVITHPGNGETRPSTQNIPFIGDGKDFEDGALPDAGLLWTSNLDGVIGTGRTFSRQLSAGANTVTLTVTDSQGNTGTRSITMTITP